jgi:putative oxidoreductase
MERVLGRFAPQVYAIMRIVLGLLFACHGAQKLFGVFGGEKMSPLSMIGFAGVIELAAGLMIAIGLLASVAAFIASGEMAVAYFMAHAPSGPLPIVNKGELAVVYCFVFLYIAAHGAGIWAIDRAPQRR